jgi:hypothetical protein
MSSPLGIIIVVILVLILLGGAAPHFYQGAPWRPGYGYGNGGISVVGILLLLAIVWLIFGGGLVHVG